MPEEQGHLLIVRTTSFSLGSACQDTLLKCAVFIPASCRNWKMRPGSFSGVLPDFPAIGGVIAHED